MVTLVRIKLSTQNLKSKNLMKKMSERTSRISKMRIFQMKKMVRILIKLLKIGLRLIKRMKV